MIKNTLIAIAVIIGMLSLMYLIRYTLIKVPHKLQEIALKIRIKADEGKQKK